MRIVGGHEEVVSFDQWIDILTSSLGTLLTKLNYSQRFSGLLEALLFDEIKENSTWRLISLSQKK